jgi:HEAT repeat protein
MITKFKIILIAIIVIFVCGIAIWQYQYPALDRSTVASGEAPKIDPAAAQPQLAGAPVAEPNNNRKFAKMSVLERDTVLLNLEKQDLASIFQAMLDAERVEHDDLKQMHLQTTFSEALKLKNPTPEFLEKIRLFLSDESNSEFERDLVFGALGEASTPETVKLLAELAKSSPSESVRDAASGSLGTVGSRGGGGSKLSPTLDKVWSDSSDEVLLASVALSMVEIGTRDSVELLLSSALETTGKDKVRMETAKSVLRKVHSKEAVPPLAARLQNQSTTSAPAMLVAPILVRIGDDAASIAVVNWLKDQSEVATPLIKNLVLQQTRSDTMLNAWEAALLPAVPFRNEKNREAIRVGLAEYRAGRIEE